jgi:8-oxo-dGTP pyrophosphatase MutT (NUDIX family)
MIKPVLKTKNYWDGVLYKFEIYLSSDFSKLSRVSQAYGAVLDEENRLLVVSQDGKDWGLPGGTVETGESLIDALIREAYEEAAVVVSPKTVKPFFHQKVYCKVGDRWKLTDIQARFVCRKERQDKFIKDPDNGKVKYQRFVDIDILDQFLKWGETTKFIQKEVLKAVIR